MNEDEIRLFDGLLRKNNLVIEHKTIKTNYDRIRNMTVKEMAEFLEHVYLNYDNTKIIIDGVRMDVAKIKQWLESEV